MQSICHVLLLFITYNFSGTIVKVSFFFFTETFPTFLHLWNGSKDPVKNLCEVSYNKAKTKIPIAQLLKFTKICENVANPNVLFDEKIILRKIFVNNVDISCSVLINETRCIFIKSKTTSK